MKHMVDQLVYEVRSENSGRLIYNETSKAKAVLQDKIKSKIKINDRKCPKCRQGKLLKGSKAYGCSCFKDGCDFILPFYFMEKKIPEKQLLRLLEKNQTINLKGFKDSGQILEGNLFLNKAFELVLKEKSKDKTIINLKLCPKCKKGEIIKGSKAYGCSNYARGCDFVFPFDLVRQLTKGKPLTEELVFSIVSNAKHLNINQ